MIAVWVAITLTALMSVAAMTLDMGVLLAESRHAQATADAAAIAGAIDLYTNYPTYNGSDTNGTAKASALTTAAANGYSNDGSTNTVTVNIPPKSGNFANVAGYVEVIVQYNEPRYFSHVLGSGTIPVKARAVARGAWVVPKGGILALDPTAPGAITASGQGNVTVSGGTVIDDSNNTSTNGALTVSGGGTLTANAFNITGSYKGSVGSPGISTTPTTGVPPTPDPYYYLPTPTPPAAGTITKTKLGSGSGFLYTFSPGSFGGSGEPKIPNLTSSDQVVFNQDPSGNGAIYYLTSGGLTSNGANLTMGSGSGGIMFYNAGTGSNDKINITGSPTGTVSLSGINTTNTGSSDYIYNGLLIFQARNAGEDVQITGNGNFTMEGTFYAPDATLKLAGQGALSIIGSNLVADQISITGQGNITVDYSGFTQPKGRFLGLVE
jgi:hypothetical protein